MTDTWTWATVTQATPLRIKVDGDTSALDATTDNLVGSLAVDDRVRVHLHSDGIIVTGLQGGGTPEATAATPNTLALRDGDGQLKAADGVAADDVATVAQLPNPNLLINSDFMVNQRGVVSGATIAPYTYFLDRWYSPSPSTRTHTWANVGGVRTLTLSGGTIRQTVEQANLPAGTYTLSWDGTTVASVYNAGGANPAGASSPLTVVLDGTDDVQIDLAGVGAAIKNVKFEQGTVATPYQPPTYADNLRACMRYYQRFGGETPYQRFGLGFAISTTQARIQIPFMTPMRVSPTVTWGTLGVRINSGIDTATNITVQAPSTTLGYLTVTVASGLTSGAAMELLADGSSDGFVAFDSEL